MGFNVWCYLPIILSVCCKLANFFMFTFSEEILSSVWRVLPTSSTIIGPLR